MRVIVDQIALFRVGGLQPGIRVVFRVRYRNEAGWSRWSRASCPVDIAPDVPDAPFVCQASAEVNDISQGSTHKRTHKRTHARHATTRMPS